MKRAILITSSAYTVVFGSMLLGGALFNLWRFGEIWNPTADPDPLSAFHKGLLVLWLGCACVSGWRGMWGK